MGPYLGITERRGPDFLSNKDEIWSAAGKLGGLASPRTVSVTLQDAACGSCSPGARAASQPYVLDMVLSLRARTVRVPSSSLCETEEEVLLLSKPEACFYCFIDDTTMKKKFSPSPTTGRPPPQMYIHVNS